MRSRLNGKLWEHLTDEEHQKFPGDYEAMVGQGAIAKHSEEYLQLQTAVLSNFAGYSQQLKALERWQRPCRS
jgi:hypothetical protein